MSDELQYVYYFSCHDKYHIYQSVRILNFLTILVLKFKQTNPFNYPFLCMTYRWRLICVCLVCSGLSVRIFRVDTVMLQNNEEQQWRSQNGFFTHTQEKFWKLCLESLSKSGLLFRERICSQREQILSFKSNPYDKGAKYFVLLSLYYKSVSYACYANA